MESGSSAPWWVKMPVERRTEILRNAVLADIVPDLVREYGAQDEAPVMRMGG